MISLTRKNISSLIVEFFLILSLLPFFLLKKEFSLAAVHISWVIITLTLFLFINFRKKVFMAFECLKITHFALTVMLITCIFLLMVPLREIILADFFKLNELQQFFSQKKFFLSYIILFWDWIVYIPAFVFSCFTLILITMEYLLVPQLNTKDFSSLNKKLQHSSIKPFFFLICLISIFCALSSYPGIWLQADNSATWAWRLEKNWNDWFCFGYQLFIYFCTLVKNRFLVIVWQTIIWLAINYYTLTILKKVSKKSLYAYTLIIFFSLSPFIYLETMAHDTIFSMSFLALSVSSFSLLALQGSKKDFFVFASSSTGVLLFRHGLFPIIFITFVCFGLYFIKGQKRSKKIILGLCIPIICYFFVNTVLFSAMKVKKIQNI